MRYARLVAVTVLALPGAAYAAPQSGNWSGCYIGASGGYEFHGRSSTSQKVNVGGTLFSAQDSSTIVKGGVGGGELGCNIDVDHFVIGPELAASYQNVSGSSDIPNLRSPGETIRSNVRSSYFGTASLRLGYSFGKLLAYGKGGVAVTTFRHSGYIFDNASGATVDVTSNGNRVSAGYIVGGGAELALRRHLSVKLEYDYLNFGSTSLPYSINLDPGLPTAATLSGPSISRDREQMVRAGFNYRF